MCPNAWLRTCSNHPCSHIYHSDTKQNIKHQMSLEWSQIFLIFEQSKLLKASGNWNELWMFRVAKLLTIVHVKTKHSTLSCITILILTQKNFFPKRFFSFAIFPLIFRHCIKWGARGGGGGNNNLLWFFSPETFLRKCLEKQNLLNSVLGTFLSWSGLNTAPCQQADQIDIYSLFNYQGKL